MQQADTSLLDEGHLDCVTARLWNGAREKLLLLSGSEDGEAFSLSLLDPQTSAVTHRWPLSELVASEVDGARVAVELSKGLWWTRNPIFCLPTPERARELHRKLIRRAGGHLRSESAAAEAHEDLAQQLAKERAARVAAEEIAARARAESVAAAREAETRVSRADSRAAAAAAAAATAAREVAAAAAAEAAAAVVGEAETAAEAAAAEAARMKSAVDEARAETQRERARRATLDGESQRARDAAARAEAAREAAEARARAEADERAAAVAEAARVAAELDAAMRSRRTSEAAALAAVKAGSQAARAEAIAATEASADAAAAAALAIAEAEDAAAAAMQRAKDAEVEAARASEARAQAEARAEAAEAALRAQAAGRGGRESGEGEGGRDGGDGAGGGDGNGDGDGSSGGSGGGGGAGAGAEVAALREAKARLEAELTEERVAREAALARLVEVMHAGAGSTLENEARFNAAESKLAAVATKLGVRAQQRLVFGRLRANAREAREQHTPPSLPPRPAEPPPRPLAEVTPPPDTAPAAALSFNALAAWLGGKGGGKGGGNEDAAGGGGAVGDSSVARAAAQAEALAVQRAEAREVAAALVETFEDISRLQVRGRQRLRCTCGMRESSPSLHARPPPAPTTTASHAQPLYDITLPSELLLREHALIGSPFPPPHPTHNSLTPTLTPTLNPPPLLPAQAQLLGTHPLELSTIEDASRQHTQADAGSDDASSPRPRHELLGASPVPSLYTTAGEALGAYEDFDATPQPPRRARRSMGAAYGRRTADCSITAAAAEGAHPKATSRRRAASTGSARRTLPASPTSHPRLQAIREERSARMLVDGSNGAVDGSNGAADGPSEVQSHAVHAADGSSDGGAGGDGGSGGGTDGGTGSDAGRGTSSDAGRGTGHGLDDDNDDDDDEEGEEEGEGEEESEELSLDADDDLAAASEAPISEISEISGMHELKDGVAQHISRRLAQRMEAVSELQRRLQRTLATEEYGETDVWPSQTIDGRRPSLNTARAQLRWSTSGIAVGAYQGFDAGSVDSERAPGSRPAE